MKYLILVFVLFTFSTNINQKPVVASYGIEPTVYLIGDNVEDWYQELTDPEWEEYPRPYGARYYDPIANLVYLVTNIVEVSNIIYTYDPNKQEKLYAIPPLSKNTNLFFQYLGNISSLQRVYKSTKNNKIYIKIMHPFTNTNKSIQMVFMILLTILYRMILHTHILHLMIIL